MSREVITVIGKTGFGKSVWARKYVAPQARLFVFDPLLTFPCEYMSCDNLIARHDNGDFDSGKSFAVGSGNLDDLEILGALSMLAGQTLMVIEECAISLDKYAKMPPWLRDIVFLGRHRDVSLLATAQRAASIPIDLRSQVTRLVSFQQSEGDDLTWLKPYLGKDILELPNLPVLTCFDCTTMEKKKYSITY